ncbi:hypothetical protein BGX38DRAFT_1275416 [Terfezia claveryi]|nr:hypothetical protein BGX38DRAFT_1275416 [Terfezia claveryi]
MPSQTSNMYSDDVEICQYLIHQAKDHGIDFILKELTQAQAQDSRGIHLSHNKQLYKVVRYFTKSQDPHTPEHGPGPNINLPLAWIIIACSERYYNTFVQRAAQNIGIAKEIGHEETVQLWQNYHDKRLSEWEECLREKEVFENSVLEI